MKYIDLLEKLEQLKVFSVQDLKMLDNKYDKSKINKWKNAWNIEQIIKWYYLLSKVPKNQNLLYNISNKIYMPSYISLESAFSYYWIIPEQVFSVIWVTTKKTNSFNTNLWIFEYKKIKCELFFGYDIKEIDWYKILIASLEKSLIDYFYLINNINSIIDFEYLRFNKQIINEKLNPNILMLYTNILNSKMVKFRIDLLLKYLNND